MNISSRVARKPVIIPAGVEVKLAGAELIVKGPKGQMQTPVHPSVEIMIDNGSLQVQAVQPQGRLARGATVLRQNKALAGTMRATIANIVTGVSKGFERKMTLVGVGYRAQVKGTELHLTVGYSHPVVIKAPKGITLEAPTLTEVLVKGMDKHLIGHVASMIRAVRSPEPYKGKGIRYADEVIVLKETKKK